MQNTVASKTPGLTSVQLLRATCHAIALTVFAALLAFPCAAADKAQGKEYLDKKAGFRLQLPPGWKKLKDKSMLAGFGGPQGGFVGFASEMSQAAPEEYLRQSKDEFQKNAKNSQKVWEGETVFAGLAARQIVFDYDLEGVRARAVSYVILSRGEYWIVIAIASRDVMLDADSDVRKQADAVLASIEFLEPTRSRLQSLIPENYAKVAPAAGQGQRRFINDKVGMRMVVPAEWQVSAESGSPDGNSYQVNLGRPGTMAFITLGHVLLEASPDLYRSEFERNVTLQEFHAISEQKVLVAGLPVTRVLYTGSDDKGVPYRALVEYFHFGRDHYVVMCESPTEVFATYRPQFQAALDSVLFTGGLPQAVPLVTAQEKGAVR